MSRVPEKKKPGDPILAADWNALVDAIEARTPRPGQGSELVWMSGGFTYRIRPSAAGQDGKPVPLTILMTRPPYIQEPESPPDAESRAKRYFIEWGTLNNLVAENWDDHFDLSQTTYFFAKATLRTTGTLKVTSWEIVTGAAYDTHKTPDWPVGENRPDSMVVLLGTVFVNEVGRHIISQSGGGSMVLSEHITILEPGSEAGETRIGKELTFHRLTY